MLLKPVKELRKLLLLCWYYIQCSKKHNWEKLLQKGLNLKSNFKLCSGRDSEKIKKTWRTNTDDINAQGLVEHEKLFDNTCKHFLMEKVKVKRKLLNTVHSYLKVLP